MYRSFTGEALTLLKDNPYSDEEVKQLLWKCYVEPWEQRKLIDPDNPIFQPKPKKIRKPRKYSEESIQRMLKRKGKDGKPKWIDPEEEERKRQHKAMNAACYARTLEKQRRLAEEELRATQSSIEHWAKAQGDSDFHPGPKGPGNTAAARLLRRTKSPEPGLRACKPPIADCKPRSAERCQSLNIVQYAVQVTPLEKGSPVLRYGKYRQFIGNVCHGRVRKKTRLLGYYSLQTKAMYSP